MIQVSIDFANLIAQAVKAPVIKAIGVVPVSIVFASDPGTVQTLELALSAQSSSPEVVAYLNTFSKQNATTYTGFLNAGDTRLVALMAGKQTTTCDCEIAITVAGEREVCPNFPVIVQSPIITGPESTEGGPVYVALDADGGLPIGTGARLLPVAHGVKLQVSIDGVTWQDVWSQIAS